MPFPRNLRRTSYPAGVHELTLGAGKQTGAGYGALADNVEGQVSYIVQNCKPKPEANCTR